MMGNPARKLVLENLADGVPAIPVEAVGYYKQNCMVCMSSQGHTSGVRMEVHHRDHYEAVEVTWDGNVTLQIDRAYQDGNKTTDFGACIIALLLLRELSEFTAIQQSNVGTTIDYYLIRQGQPDDTFIFDNAGYLEVSGIRCETPDNTVEDRIKDKVKRLKKQEDLPTFISVVEFSRPWSKTILV